MVVMVILSFFLVVSIPVMKGAHRRNQLAAAAREFVVLARYARQQAILRGSAVEIRVELPKNRYNLELDPNPDPQRARSSAREKRSGMEEARFLDSARQRIFFKSIACAGDPFGRDNVAKIRFFKDGSASPTVLVVADTDKRQMTIEISGASGAVRVYNGAPEAAAEVPVEEAPAKQGGA